MGRLSVVMLVVLASTTGVLGDLVTASGTAGGITSGSASLSLSGSATLSGSGTYYSWVGWPTSAFQAVPLTFGNATPGFGSGPTGIGSNPTGSLTASLDPTDAPSYDALTRLEHGSLNDLNVNIKDGASYGLGTFGGWSITGSGGGGSVTLTLGTFGMALSALDFDMTGGATGGLTGYSSNPPANQMVQATYSISPYGNLSASLGSTSAAVSATFAGVGTVSIGSLAFGGGSNSTTEALTGSMVMTELAGPYPRDAQIHVVADTTAGVSIAFGASGPTYNYNNYSGGTAPYYMVSLNYGVSGTATANSAHMDIYTTLSDVIPEPMTLVVFGLGGAMLTLARRRSR